MMTLDYHKPVLLDEAVSALNLANGSVVIDCNLGTGGHAEAILEKILPDGRLIGIDVDAEAIKTARERLSRFEGKFIFFQTNFKKVDEIVKKLVLDRVDAVIFDLGISSIQMDSEERGFSFKHDAPLDMRMEKEGRLTACDIVNKFSKEELVRIFKDYGEVESPGAAAASIDRARTKGPIRTTFQLLEALNMPLERRYFEKIHPATKIFQALRIAVNDEIRSLEEALPKAINLLSPGGRICVISFHSLEDRIAKRTFEYFAKKCVCPPDFPVCVCDKKEVVKVITKKPITPGEAEIEANPRARSAKLRAAEKLSPAGGIDV